MDNSNSRWECAEDALRCDGSDTVGGGLDILSSVWMCVCVQGKTTVLSCSFIQCFKNVCACLSRLEWRVTTLIEYSHIIQSGKMLFTYLKRACKISRKHMSREGRKEKQMRWSVSSYRYSRCVDWFTISTQAFSSGWFHFSSGTSKALSFSIYTSEGFFCDAFSKKHYSGSLLKLRCRRI